MDIALAAYNGATSEKLKVRRRMVLSIEQSESAQGVCDYLTKHLSPGDYYLRGTSQSQWVGAELGRLGLQEGQAVAAQDFRAIAHNRKPGTRQRLTVRD